MRLSQILLNLGTNAVKFTDKGEVEIKVIEVKRSKEQTTLQFSVRDTGIGISEEQQARLFQAFSQADISTTRQYGGTGLGLAISKRLVEMMGGKIWIKSDPGKGSDFSFTATFVLSDTMPLNPTVGYKELHGMRVLVVDDNAQAREVFSTMLDSMNFKVDAVESAAEALDVIAATDQFNPFGVVIMDWKMPGMDGLEASRRIKQSRQLNNPPRIILTTAYGREDAMAESEKIGMDGFLIKPVTPSLIFDAIVLAVCRDDICSNDWMTSPNEQQEQDSFGGGMVLLVEDNEINELVATEVLKGAGLEVEVANNGREAVEAVKSRSYDAVLMDVQMPVMDGYEATRLIRTDPRFTDLPIIAMTAGAMMGDREKALASGMNDFVTKPIDTKQLFRTLADYVQPNAAAAAAPDGLQTAQGRDDLLPGIPGLDSKAGLGRLGGNQELYRKLLMDFAKGQQEVLSKVKQALADREIEQADKLVHALKGVAGNIEAMEIFERAQDLDLKLKTGQDQDFAPQLEELAAVLDPMLEVLSGLKTEETATAKPEEAPTNPEKIKALLAKLTGLLEENDLEAKEILPELRSKLEGDGAAKYIGELEQHLSQFDFEAAQESLHSLSLELEDE